MGEEGKIDGDEVNMYTLASTVNIYTCTCSCTIQHFIGLQFREMHEFASIRENISMKIAQRICAHA